MTYEVLAEVWNHETGPVQMVSVVNLPNPDAACHQADLEFQEMAAFMNDPTMRWRILRVVPEGQRNLT